MKSVLPEYMVPSAIVMLDQIPLNANGKVDREALSAPDLINVYRTEQYVPARSELEKRLAEIWQGVLGLEKISINDNFFEVGGTSLLVLVLRRRIESYLQEPVPVADLFQYPTIKYFSEYLSQSDKSRQDLDGGSRARMRLQMAEQRQLNKQKQPE
jgi:hypothetical protein